MWNGMPALRQTPRIRRSEGMGKTAPGRVNDATETRFPIVPEGTKRPASLPNREAAYSSSARTEGSSPRWESPTFARAIAFLIPGEGSVTVSDRRSTGGVILLSRRAGKEKGPGGRQAEFDQFPVSQRAPPGGGVQGFARHGDQAGLGLEEERIVVRVPAELPEGEQRLSVRNQHVRGGVCPHQFRVPQKTRKRLPKPGKGALPPAVRQGFEKDEGVAHLAPFGLFPDPPPERSVVCENDPVRKERVGVGGVDRFRVGRIPDVA